MLFAIVDDEGTDKAVGEIITSVILFTMLFAYLFVVVCFLLTLNLALRRIDPRNRRMQPWQIWLNLIPGFHFYWGFLSVSRLTESLTHEFNDRGIPANGNFGASWGINLCILNLLSTVLAIIPCIGFLFAMANLVCWLVYWLKIAGYSRQLRADDEDFYSHDRDDYDR